MSARVSARVAAAAVQPRVGRKQASCLLPWPEAARLAQSTDSRGRFSASSVTWKLSCLVGLAVEDTVAPQELRVGPTLLCATGSRGAVGGPSRGDWFWRQHRTVDLVGSRPPDRVPSNTALPTSGFFRPGCSGTVTARSGPPAPCQAPFQDSCFHRPQVSPCLGPPCRGTELLCT